MHGLSLLLPGEREREREREQKEERGKRRRTLQLALMGAKKTKKGHNTHTQGGGKSLDSNLPPELYYKSTLLIPRPA